MGAVAVVRGPNVAGVELSNFSTVIRDMMFDDDAAAGFTTGETTDGGGVFGAKPPKPQTGHIFYFIHCFSDQQKYVTGKGELTKVS